MALRLRLQHALSAPPDTAWELVTDPPEMSVWSLAPVRGIDEGDGGGYAAVGALRRVELPAPLGGITEVIEHADAPTRLVYRVVGTRAVRHHRGEIRLEPHRDGTLLHWDVDAATAVPALDGVLHRILEPSVETSLRQLADLVDARGQWSPARRARARSFTDDEPTEQLWADTQQVVEDLDRLGTQLEAVGDDRFWFARVYRYVTEEIRDACRRDEVTHRSWALRLIPGFHTLFVKSVEGPAEDHWQEAFDAITSVATTGSSSAMAFWRAIVAGARAHIAGDLPRVLADVHVDHYADRCDYVRFRADYLLLASALQQAWKRMSDTVPSAWSPSYIRMLDHLLPPEAIEFLLAKRFFDPLSARRDAFDVGRRLAQQGAARR